MPDRTYKTIDLGKRTYLPIQGQDRQYDVMPKYDTKTLLELKAKLEPFINREATPFEETPQAQAVQDIKASAQDVGNALSNLQEQYQQEYEQTTPQGKYTKALQQALVNAPTQEDYSPILALNTSEVGRNLRQMYKAPMSAQDKLQFLAQLENKNKETLLQALQKKMANAASIEGRKAQIEMLKNQLATPLYGQYSKEQLQQMQMRQKALQDYIKANEGKIIETTPSQKIVETTPVQKVVETTPPKVAMASAKKERNIFQEQTDKKMADALAAYATSGKASGEQAIKTLENVIPRLQEQATKMKKQIGTTSGWFNEQAYAWLPEGKLRTIMFSDIEDARVLGSEKSIQETIKNLKGAISDKDLTFAKNNAFDPALPLEKNVARFKNTLEYIKGIKNEMDKMQDYATKHKTMEGFNYSPGVKKLSREEALKLVGGK